MFYLHCRATDLARSFLFWCFTAVAEHGPICFLPVYTLDGTNSPRVPSLLFSLWAETCREVLPVAEAPGPRVLLAEEHRRLLEQEENTLRELRLFLRDVTKRLATDKRFNIFSKPVDIEEVRAGLDTTGCKDFNLASVAHFCSLCFRCRTIWRSSGSRWTCPPL